MIRLMMTLNNGVLVREEQKCVYLVVRYTPIFGISVHL